VKSIIQNLRDFSRTQAEDWDESDINASLESTLKILSSQINASQCEIKLELTTIPTIWCNLGELNQVFLNLINNALQAMEHSPEKVLTLTSHANNTDILLSIEDTGEGMSEEVQKSIFDPFFTTKEIGQGTGLGLYISQKVIDDHQGKIEVKSEAGKGTKFIITLPIQHKKQLE